MINLILDLSIADFALNTEKNLKFQTASEQSKSKKKRDRGYMGYDDDADEGSSDSDLESKTGKTLFYSFVCKLHY